MEPAERRPCLTSAQRNSPRSAPAGRRSCLTAAPRHSGGELRRPSTALHLDARQSSERRASPADGAPRPEYHGNPLRRGRKPGVLQVRHASDRDKVVRFRELRDPKRERGTRRCYPLAVFRASVCAVIQHSTASRRASSPKYRALRPRWIQPIDRSSRAMRIAGAISSALS